MKKDTTNLLIGAKVLNEILIYFNNTIIEEGGALLFDNSTNSLFLFIPLQNISQNPSSEYLFSFDELNMKIGDYMNDNISFIGIIHSHQYSPLPSKDDINFFSNLIKENDYECLLFPIYCHKAKPLIRWWMMNGKGVKEVTITPIN